MVDDKLFRRWYYVWAALFLFDILVTGYGVVYRGALELNPLMDFAIKRGFGTFVMLKLAVLFGVTASLFYLQKERDGTNPLRFLTGFYLCVALVNVMTFI